MLSPLPLAYALRHPCMQQITGQAPIPCPFPHYAGEGESGRCSPPRPLGAGGRGSRE
jgi:hypothetical protein